MEETSISGDNTEKGLVANVARLRRWAFAAGMCYSVIIICNWSAEIGVREGLIDFNDPSDTALQIRRHSQRLRVSLMLDLTKTCADVVVSILFGFILLHIGANPVLSLCSVVFRLMQQAVIASDLLLLMAAALALDHSLHPTMPVSDVIDRLDTGEQDIGESVAFFFLRLHKYGNLLALIFFGVSLGLLGFLVIWQNVFCPRWLGIILLIAGIGYSFDSILFFLWNGYDGQLSPFLVCIPALVSEFGLTGYLLLRTPKLGATVRTVD